MVAHFPLLLLVVAVLLGSVPKICLGYLTAPQQPITVCAIGGAPTIAAKDILADGDIISSVNLRNKLQGIGIDLITAVFTDILKYPYQVVYKTGFSKVLYETRKKQCDVTVQALFVAASRDSCTASCFDPANSTSIKLESDDAYEPYTCCIDFSYSYYDGGWSIMARTDGSTTNYIDLFFQQDVVHALCVCVIVVFFVAHVVWIIERTNFGKVPLIQEAEYVRTKYLDGLRDSVWYSALLLLNGIIMSGKMATTPWTRVLSSATVFFGLLMNCFITALISSTLTTSTVNNGMFLAASDLAGRKLCLPRGFFDYYFTKTFPGVGVLKHSVADITDCLPLLEDGTVDAAFGIREELLGMLKSHRPTGMYISPVVSRQVYALVWSQDYKYASDINEALLAYRENTATNLTAPKYSESVQTWYSGSATEVTYSDADGATSGETEWNWGLIGAAVALTACYVLLQALVMLGAHFARQEAAFSKSQSSLDPSVHKSSIGRHRSFVTAVSRKLSAQVDSALGNDDGDDYDQGLDEEVAMFKAAATGSLSMAAGAGATAAAGGGATAAGGGGLGGGRRGSSSMKGSASMKGQQASVAPQASLGRKSFNSSGQLGSVVMKSPPQHVTDILNAKRDVDRMYQMMMDLASAGGADITARLQAVMSASAAAGGGNHGSSAAAEFAFKSARSGSGPAAQPALAPAPPEAPAPAPGGGASMRSARTGSSSVRLHTPPEAVPAVAVITSGPSFADQL